MQTIVWACSLVFLAGLTMIAGQLSAQQPIKPHIEFQSRPLTPGLVLEECPWRIHQIRILVNGKSDRGILVLDGSTPEFNEFGILVGGLQTPHVRGNDDEQSKVRLDCDIEMLKEGPDKWRLYLISGPKIQTPLRIACKKSLAAFGPAQLVVLGSGDKVNAVVPFTRYGLVTP